MKRKTFARVPPEVPVSSLTPLNVTCGSTKCSDDLHCFRMAERHIKKHGKHGVCKECGSELIDWNRIHKNDVKDAKFIFKSLKKELIRHVFWHTPIPDVALQKARSRGIIQLSQETTAILRRKIGGASGAWDGRQTPLTGSEVIHYGQHATATCCRRCLNYWHGIPLDQPLTESQIEFCTSLVLLYIEERVPELSKEGEHVTVN